MTTSKPLISVLIPCHNYGRFLGQAIESIIMQSWENWECLIVDDGSSDNTEQVAEHYENIDARIHYIKQENGGVSSARNTALVASKGDFIQFLDADDKIQSDKLANHVNYLLSHPDVDLVYSDAEYFYEEDEEPSIAVSNRMGFPNISATGNHLLIYLIRRNIMVINSPLIRHRAIKEIGLFNISLRGHEDWEYWIRMAINGKAFHYYEQNNSNALVRVHARSAVQKSAPMLLSNLQVRRELSKLTLNPSLHHLNQRGIGFQLVKLAKLEARDRNFGAALLNAIEALASSHCSPLVLLALLMPLPLSTHLAIAASRLTRRPL